jgi:trimeric autotransporter adhesin
MPVTINGTTGITTPDLDSTADISANGVNFGEGGGNISTNTSAGNGALVANTTGAESVAVGFRAGFSNTTASGNVYIGPYAGQLGTTAARNTAVGQAAGYSLTTGSGNTFVGTAGSSNNFGAGWVVTTGNNNTVIGAYSGNQYNIDIRTASSNIVVSDGNGLPRIATANGNTYLYAADNSVIITTSNTKGGTVNILGTSSLFPRLNWGGNSILLVQMAGSDGIAGGVNASYLIAVSERFGSYICTVLSSSINDGLSGYTNTFSYNGSAFRVTQNWGSGGTNIGCFWNIINVTGALSG